MNDKSKPSTWRIAFDERHEFDVYPDDFMSGMRNEFCAGWYAALKANAASTPASDAAMSDEQATDDLAAISDDAHVDLFATAMKEKLAQARAKGRTGWIQCAPADLSRMLREHVEKGDPRDVANFCMFLWAMGELITPLADAVHPNVLNAVHRSVKTGGYANFSEAWPVAVQPQLEEHQLTEFEIYDFSDGISKIMTRTEFDKEHGRDLRIQLEQARENRKANEVMQSDRAGDADQA
jgi:hypothetical protein